MVTVVELAAEAYGFFHKDTRADGATTFWYADEGRPDWLDRLIRDAHGDFMPDDWRYEFIAESLVTIAHGAEDADLDELGLDTIEADVYSGELLRWLSSNLTRASYVDDAMEEYGGEIRGIMALIALGQVREKLEVYDAVLAHLRTTAAEFDDVEEDDAE